jgi:hypothetical protein
MPVKSQSSSPGGPQKEGPRNAPTLKKRQIAMPDGRYMIFYTDDKDVAKDEVRQEGNV